MNNTIDWNKVLIRCSSLGCLFTEPVGKADKEAGVLSKTAKAHLIEVYAREIWGVEKDLLTKQVKKGKAGEESGITLVSLLDKKLYIKNEERKQNEWVTGHADIVEPEEIQELKLSWDAFTFLPKIMEAIDKDYYYQCQGYLWLYNKPLAKLRYCLVDTPDFLIQGEKYRLLRSMDIISEESPEYIEAARKLESNMKYDHLPVNQRVITHTIYREQEIIDRIPAKVAAARKFLQGLHEKHMNQYPK